MRREENPFPGSPRRLERRVRSIIFCWKGNCVAACVFFFRRWKHPDHAIRNHADLKLTNIPTLLLNVNVKRLSDYVERKIKDIIERDRDLF